MLADYKNISQILENFFKEKKDCPRIEGVIFICRNDGTFIYARRSASKVLWPRLVRPHRHDLRNSDRIHSTPTCATSVDVINHPSLP